MYQTFIFLRGQWFSCPVEVLLNSYNFAFCVHLYNCFDFLCKLLNILSKLIYWNNICVFTEYTVIVPTDCTYYIFVIKYRIIKCMSQFGAKVIVVVTITCKNDWSCGIRVNNFYTSLPLRDIFLPESNLYICLELLEMKFMAVFEFVDVGDTYTHFLISTIWTRNM